MWKAVSVTWKLDQKCRSWHKSNSRVRHKSIESLFFPTVQCLKQIDQFMFPWVCTIESFKFEDEDDYEDDI